jgi:glycosyltransferase involved in cell wall biosynthesis
MQPGGSFRRKLAVRSAPIVVCFPFIGDELGGSHVSAVKLINALDAKLVAPIVVLHVTDGPLAEYLADHRVPFVEAPGGPFPIRSRVAASDSRTPGLLSYTLRAAAPIARFLKDRRVDLIHTNDGRMHIAWALPGWFAGARQVWHHRGDPDALGVNLVAPLLAGHVVTVSNFSAPRRPIIKVGHKLSVVHSPFDRPAAVDRYRARAALIDELGCAQETRFLAYFGLLVERKRPVRFVEAVAAYIKRYPEVPVVGLLFGDTSSESPDLDRIVTRRAEELGIGDRIRLMGFRRPVEPWMATVDVLLVPAVREPFGRTLIEAMFLGTPVVATDDGGNREAIEHGVTGFLVPPDRPESFIDPIHMLLTDPERRDKIVDTARGRACACYGIETHVRRLTDIYEALA